MRCDRIPYIKYFSAEDFGLSAEKISYKKHNGYLYRKDGVEKRDGILIFCHGMGPGQAAYTTEIAYFCGKGYTVLAFDSRGCGLSAGGIGGMYSGVRACTCAIDYATNVLNAKKILLVGHSWGGYSVLCASARSKVDRAVAISAPASPVKSLSVSPALYPAIWLNNLFKFGAKGNTNAAKCAKTSGVPILLVHGGKDNVVKKNNAVFYLSDGSNIQKLLCDDKAHNPYNTVNAEKKLSELSMALSKAKTMSAEEKQAYFSSFDFAAATEEDPAVMQAITKFLEN